MTENESTTKELTGKEKRLANLKPIQSLTDEEKHNLAVMGGKARAEQKRKQRTMREQAQEYLKAIVSGELAEKFLGHDEASTLTEEDLTVQGVMIAKMAFEAMQNGNAKAAEFVRDTSGQRPKDIIEVSAEIMTEADRNLIANMAEILQAKQP